MRPEVSALLLPSPATGSGRVTGRKSHASEYRYSLGSFGVREVQQFTPKKVAGRVRRLTLDTESAESGYHSLAGDLLRVQTSSHLHPRRLGQIRVH